MPILKSNTESNNFLKRHPELRVAFFLLLVILGAQLDLNLGTNISFTLQTLALGLAYYYLPLPHRFLVILPYLTLGALGVPVFNAGAGWDYITSWPLGFFAGFVVAGFLYTPSKSPLLSVFLFFLKVHSVIVLLGVVWLWIYGQPASQALHTFIELSPGMLIKSIVGTLIIWGVSRMPK